MTSTLSDLAASSDHRERATKMTLAAGPSTLSDLAAQSDQRERAIEITRAAGPLPPELAGKGKRVASVFVFMMGASIILDTHAVWVGVPLLAVAAILFARGIAEARAPESIVAPAHDAPTEARP